MGRAAVNRHLPEILEDGENGLSARFRAELAQLADELRHLDTRVTHYDTQIEAVAQQDEQVQRLMTIPGVGAKGATALVAAVGDDPRLFKNGRALAAWLGLVPRQHSTGGRDRLLGISKRGDVYLRQLLVHGRCCAGSSAKTIRPAAGRRRSRRAAMPTLRSWPWPTRSPGWPMP